MASEGWRVPCRMVNDGFRCAVEKSLVSHKSPDMRDPEL